MRKYLIPLAIMFMAVHPATAATNQIYVLDQTGYIPSGLFMFISVIAVATLIAAYRWVDDMCGILSVAASFMLLWTSRMVDYATGVVVNSDSSISVIHTVYKPDILTAFGIVCLVLAILNGYRIYVLSKQDTTFVNKG